MCCVVCCGEYEQRCVCGGVKAVTMAAMVTDGVVYSVCYRIIFIICN